MSQVLHIVLGKTILCPFAEIQTKTSSTMNFIQIGPPISMPNFSMTFVFKQTKTNKIFLLHNITEDNLSSMMVLSDISTRWNGIKWVVAFYCGAATLHGGRITATVALRRQFYSDSRDNTLRPRCTLKKNTTWWDVKTVTLALFSARNKR